MAKSRNKSHQQIWRHKKILRDIYCKWYQRIVNDLAPGQTLEIGSGSGNFKSFAPFIISSDVEKLSWIDKVIDAHHLPFKKDSLGNIVLIDTLHHLNNPLQFLKESARVLKKGGRLILNEPYPSPISIVIYKIFHPEPFIFDQNVFTHKKTKKKNAWQSNQAIPYLIFFKEQKLFQTNLGKSFSIIKRDKIAFLSYPLSGGFEHKTLVPVQLFPIIGWLEGKLHPLKHILAFRCYIILEKQ